MDGRAPAQRNWSAWRDAPQMRWPPPSRAGSGTTRNADGEERGQRETRTAKAIREITFAVRGIDTAPLKGSYEHQGT